MSVTTTAPATTPPSARSSAYEQPTPPEIDASCSGAVSFLIISSVCWLTLSLLISLVASIKLHGPGFLGHSAALTYGRLVAAASATFLYGFASQAAIAIALWLFCRLGRTFLIFRLGVYAGGLLWNIAVTLGFLGILAGGTTAIPFFEMPGLVWPVIFIAYLLLGLSALLTFVARTEKDLYPSVWFLLAAFFVFPWIYSTAGLLLVKYPVRAPMQPIVGTWFANNFHMLWLGSIALAVIFYFVSKLAQNPLHSLSLAAFGFWFYILLANASGFQNVAAVPNWMPSLSTFANVLLLLPGFVIAVDWYHTWTGHGTKNKRADITSKYITFAAVVFLLYQMLNVISSIREVDRVVGLTLFPAGVLQFSLLGFITMAFLGAIAHIFPRLVEIDWPRAKFMSLHFGLSALGIVLVVIGLLGAGIIEGQALSNPSIPFMKALHSTMAPTGIVTIGYLSLFFAQLLLLCNIATMLKYCCSCCGFGGNKKEVAR